MEEALKVLGLKLVRWQSKEMKDVHDTPECVHQTSSRSNS